MTFTKILNSFKSIPVSDDSIGDSLDAEVANVIKEYDSHAIRLTTDEAVGVALARIYARCRTGDPGQYTLRIASRVLPPTPPSPPITDLN